MFKLLFINDMDLEMAEPKDFYKEIDNEKRAKDLFELVRKEDIDNLMSAFPVSRLHYVAADGCALFMREVIDEMDNDTFELYLKYHFATCERKDLLGITSHALDIFRK